MSPRLARRIARRFGVQLYAPAAAPRLTMWCAAVVSPRGEAFAAHYPGDTPDVLRARCRWARDAAQRAA